MPNDGKSPKTESENAARSLLASPTPISTDNPITGSPPQESAHPTNPSGQVSSVPAIITSAQIISQPHNATQHPHTYPQNPYQYAPPQAPPGYMVLYHDQQPLQPLPMNANPVPITPGGIQAPGVVLNEPSEEPPETHIKMQPNQDKFTFATGKRKRGRPKVTISKKGRKSEGPQEPPVG